MVYLRHLLYHEDLLLKIEKVRHPFSEDNPFFSISEIQSTSQNNISKIVSIKNKTKAEKLLERLDFLQVLGQYYLQHFTYLQDFTLQKQKRPFSALF